MSESVTIETRDGTFTLERFLQKDGYQEEYWVLFVPGTDDIISDELKGFLFSSKKKMNEHLQRSVIGMISKPDKIDIAQLQKRSCMNHFIIDPERD